MRVVLLTSERAKALGVPLISPTAVTGWLECERKWAFRYIAKIYPPSAASAELGTDAHKQLELYLTEGKPLDFTRPSGEILQAGLRYFPEPKTPGLEGEGDFYLRSERTGHVYMGKKDVGLPPGVPQPQLGFDGTVPIVEDLKTTSSIDDWAKDEETLRFDPQAGMYAIESMVRFDANAADLGWIFCQTKKTKKAHPVAFRMRKDAAERLFDAVESVADEMRTARESVTAESVLMLPANPAACRAYGGCPYQNLCNLSPSQKARAQMSHSLIASLRNRVQGAEASTFVPTPMPTQLSLPAKDEIPEVLKHPYVPKSVEGAAVLGLPPPTVTPIFHVDPINPPESKLPPAPLPEKASAEDEKPKKERKPRTSKKDTAPQVQVNPVTPVVTVDNTLLTPEEERIVAAARAEDIGFTLYVDCLPVGQQITEADILIEEANEIVVERQKSTEEPVQHYSFISFGKSKGALALALEEVLDNHPDLEHVFCASTSDALGTLTRYADRVIRSVR